MAKRRRDVSIVIPSYNRCGTVVRAVRDCLSLDPGPREVVVVDDHSDSDPTNELVSLDPAVVRVIRLASNIGQAGARSVAFAHAAGQLIVSLDDDSRFIDLDALDRVWRRFELSERCGVLAFATFAPAVPVRPPLDRVTKVADHITCGAAYRASVLRETGYHTEWLRYMGEESEISIKTIDAGFDVLHDESIRVFHDYDPTGRSPGAVRRSRRFAVRNDMVVCWLHFPLELAVPLSLWRALSNVMFGLRRQMLVPTILGIVSAVGASRRALVARRPVRRWAARRAWWT